MTMTSTRTDSAPTTPQRARTAHALTGTGTLVRLGLRRDRIKLPAWIAGLGIFVIYIGTALPLLAPSEEDLSLIHI